LAKPPLQHHLDPRRGAGTQSRQGGKKLGVILKGTKFALPMNIAGGLFALGMGLTADRWWEIALWLILMGMFGVRIYELKIEN